MGCRTAFKPGQKKSKFSSSWDSLNPRHQLQLLSFNSNQLKIKFYCIAMQGTALQACKVQTTGLSGNVAPAAARASVQALRPQAPSFVKTQIVQTVRGSAISAVTEAPAPSPASPPSER